VQRLLAGPLSLVTTDELASATLRYAKCLVDMGESDLVTVPGAVDGDTVECTLLLGGSAQLAAIPDANADFAIPGADEAAAEIRRRINPGSNAEG
jgi:hypothetical protein